MTQTTSCRFKQQVFPHTFSLPHFTFTLISTTFSEFITFIIQRRDKQKITGLNRGKTSENALIILL